MQEFQTTRTESEYSQLPKPQASRIPPVCMLLFEWPRLLYIFILEYGALQTKNLNRMIVAAKFHFLVRPRHPPVISQIDHVTTDKEADRAHLELANSEK